MEGDDFDDDDTLEDSSDESGVQLGTVVAIEGPPETVLFRNTDWHGWDGGKAGGWPVRSRNASAFCIATMLVLTTCYLSIHCLCVSLSIDCITCVAVRRHPHTAHRIIL